MDDMVEGCQATYPPIVRIYVPGTLYRMITGYEVNDETRRIVDIKQTFDGRCAPSFLARGISGIFFLRRLASNST